MNKLWQAYKYTFYWLYTWQKKLFGEKDFPHYTVVFGLSLSLLAVIMIIIVYMEIITGFYLLPEKLPDKKKLLVFIFIPVVIHYFVFIRKDYYRQLEKKFSRESKEVRSRKGKWVLLYAFGPLVFYILTLFLSGWIKSNGN